METEIRTRMREPKACRTCSNAKVKCVPENDGPCKRCRRLNKECIIQQPGAHRRQAQTTSVARLEKKLDNMAALLASANGVNSQGQSPAQTVSTLPVSPPTSPESRQILPTDDEAKILLDIFRTHMAPQFPFIVIPHHVTPAILREEKPFLYLTIMMVSCQAEVVRQMALSRLVREYISENIILGAQKSLDSLQGLIVCLAWYQFQLKLEFVLDLMNITHLMLAMLIELGLNKSAVAHEKSKPTIGYLRRAAMYRQGAVERTLDERRAFLGCFYLTTIVSICLKDMDALRYTDYARDCCQVLSQAVEYNSDKFLVNLVWMNRMAGRINSTLSIDDGNPPESSAPIGICVQLLEKEFQELKPSLYGGTLEDSSLLLHYYTMEMWLYQVALDDIPTARFGNNPTTRSNMLSSCLTSTKNFFDHILTLPTQTYITSPYPIFSLVSHALAVLSKLHLYIDPTWDRTHVCSVIDFATTVDHICAKMDAGTRAARGPEMVKLFIPHIRVLKDLHEILVAALEEKERVQSVLTPGDFDVRALPEEQFRELLRVMASQFPDEGAWGDFMAD